MQTSRSLKMMLFEVFEEFYKLNVFFTKEAEEYLMHFKYCDNIFRKNNT